MAFDITKLNKSSFRGIPFYTREEELTGAQRLTDHKFINGGTKTESNGIDNDVFKITGYIGGDNYLIQKEALREAFKNAESGILIDKFNGTNDVYVDKWAIKETITAFGRATIEVTFKLAENKLVEDIAIVFTADIRDDSIINLKNDFVNEAGDEINDSIIDSITEFWNDIQDNIKFLESIRDESQNIKDTVGSTISKVKTSILSVVSLSEDIVDVWTSFDEALDTDLFGIDEQKSLTSSLRETIANNADKTFTNEAEILAHEQSTLYINTSVAGLTQMAINNLENISFDTGDDFGSVKDDVLMIFELLEESIIIDSDSLIDEIEAKQNLLDSYHTAKKEFIQFYTQKFSGLQTLKDNNIVATTDILNITMEKYNDISRVSEVLVNNDIVDPLFINGDILLLDR